MKNTKALSNKEYGGIALNIQDIIKNHVNREADVWWARNFQTPQEKVDYLTELGKRYKEYKLSKEIRSLPLTRDIINWFKLLVN